MARVFITGSSDGLGRNAAKLLIEQGHTVVLHARNDARARDAMSAVPKAERVLVADFASLEQVKRLAEQANSLGTFDAVIHNAAIGYREKRRLESEDGFSHVFAINTLAPYALTALMRLPKRLVFVSSELHRRGRPDLDRPRLGEAPILEWYAGLLGYETARRAARLRGGTPMAGHAVERA